jgi:heat shock protein HslJ
MAQPGVVETGNGVFPFCAAMSHANAKRRRTWSWCIGCVAVLAAGCVAGLPEGLSSPDQRVVCNTARGACYDRFGPSIGLTQAFLGRAAAAALTAELREEPAAARQANFSPAPGIECVRAAGPCRRQGKVLGELTAILFGPWPETGLDAELRSILGIEWKWLGSRYNNDTSLRPADPSRYTVRLEANGFVQARVDCNRAGGRYRLAERRLTIELMHSTMAACEPGSLEAVFRQDLARTGHFHLRDGRLFVDLGYDTGTMEFGR